jgi:hypothetical protein
MAPADHDDLFDRLADLGWRSFRRFLDRLAVQVERDVALKRRRAGLTAPRKRVDEDLPLFRGQD